MPHYIKHHQTPLALTKEMFYSHFWCKAFWIRVSLATLYCAYCVPGTGHGITCCDVETKPQRGQLTESQVHSERSLGLRKAHVSPAHGSAFLKAQPAPICCLGLWANSCENLQAWHGSIVVLPVLKSCLWGTVYKLCFRHGWGFISSLLDMNSLKLRSKILEKIKTKPRFFL